jgi:hypothetical protein
LPKTAELIEAINVDNEEWSINEFLEKKSEIQDKIDDIDTIEGLKDFYKKNEWLGKDFWRAVSKRKNELQAMEIEEIKPEEPEEEIIAEKIF